MDEHKKLYNSDSDLIQAVGEKKLGAIESLYNKYSRLSYGVITAIVRNTDEAEDILQEVFILIWKNAESYNELLGSAKAWIIRISRNKAVDYLRSKRNKQKKEEAFSLDDSDSFLTNSKELSYNNVSTEIENNEANQNIYVALNKLPNEQRDLIYMSFIMGYTHYEIVAITGNPLGTIKTRIRTGIIALRNHLKNYSQDF
jgi:RNA polymerase sigma-70 factor (ECF subfamily)